MKIRTDVIEKIKDSVVELLTHYKGGIESAIKEEGMVSIALPVKMVQNGEKLDVQVGINFVKDRIKDDIVFTISDQRELFGPDGVSIEAKILSKVTNMVNEDGGGTAEHLSA